MKDTTIREAKIEDIATIQDLSHELFVDGAGSVDPFSDYSWPKSERGRASFENSIKNNKIILLVAEVDSTLVGYLEGGEAEFQDWRPIKRTEIFSFYIDPKYRSRGLGALMTEDFIGWSKRQKAVTTFVDAYSANDRGIEFYKRMGFEPETLRLEIIIDESKRLR